MLLGLVKRQPGVHLLVRDEVLEGQGHLQRSLLHATLQPGLQQLALLCHRTRALEAVESFANGGLVCGSARPVHLESLPQGHTFVAVQVLEKLVGLGLRLVLRVLHLLIQSAFGGIGWHVLRLGLARRLRLVLLVLLRFFLLFLLDLGHTSRLCSGLLHTVSKMAVLQAAAARALEPKAAIDTLAFF